MSVSRRPDLDWLRVLAFGLLIAYHAGMAWSGWNWHVTSIDSIDWLREGMRFVNRWRMPLIFVVSGAAIALALGSRRPHTFALNRVKRLLVPLVFGTGRDRAAAVLSSGCIAASSPARSSTGCRRPSKAAPTQTAT